MSSPETGVGVYAGGWCWWVGGVGWGGGGGVKVNFIAFIC